MSWRVVVITKRCKLEYKLGYLVCRGEETTKIFIDDISTLIVESTAVAITTSLMLELGKKNVNVMFCDERHNPFSQLCLYNGRFNCSGMLKKQLSWSEERKRGVWTQIIRLKLERQRDLLKRNSIKEFDLVDSYLNQLCEGDSTNREGHAAKVFFDALFGVKFKRERESESAVNSALNYGYSVILSAFNREITSDGYNTQLGLWHKSEFNFFNLSCDLMEPFRIVVDKFVYENLDDVSYETGGDLSADFRHRLCDLLNQTVIIGDEKCTLTNAIDIYCKSVFNSLDEDAKLKIVCYEL